MAVFTRNPISAVLTDENGYKLTSLTPLPVNPAESGTANFTTGQIAVTGSATLIAAANATRRAILIKNADAALILYVGNAAVTVATGTKVAAGEAIVIPIVTAIYGIGTGSLTATYIEVYD